MRYLRSIYGKLYGARIIRGKQLPLKYQYYGGADWFTVRDDCAKNVLEFSEKEPEFETLSVDFLSGAEIYYVSIFEMIKGTCSIEDKNMLRYVDWKERGRILTVGNPNTCTMDFVDDIEQSGAYFARKFDTKIDSEIIKYFYENSDIVSTM